MSEDAFSLKTGHGNRFTYAFYTCRKQIPVAQIPEPRHACVHLDVDAERAAQAGSLLGVLHGLGLAGYSLRDVVLEQPSHLLLRRVAEDQDRHCDPVQAKLHRLVDAADREIVRAVLLERARHDDGTVAVGVSLHDPEEFYVRSDMLAQRAVVVNQRVQIDLRPGAFQC